MLTPRKPIQIRGLVIDPPLLLAPMAGLTHSALRQIMSGFGGVGLLSTEMLSARRLPTENPGISPYLIRASSERPLSYQLLTSTPGELGRAIDVLHACKADAVDLNMGCPAPAVGQFGAGISLMEQPAERSPHRGRDAETHFASPYRKDPARKRPRRRKTDELLLHARGRGH